MTLKKEHSAKRVNFFLVPLFSENVLCLVDMILLSQRKLIVFTCHGFSEATMELVFLTRKVIFMLSNIASSCQKDEILSAVPHPDVRVIF